MAGFLGFFDFTKEGPGVQKNEPDKGPFLETLDILMRRFWELIKVNLMMIMFQLPALIIGFGTSLIVLSSLFPSLSVESISQTILNIDSAATSQALETAAMTQLTLLYVIIAIALVSLMVFVIGPFQAGFSFILRNYIRDEHVFTWSDFWDHTKANLKQSVLASLISFGVTLILVINIAFYRNATTFLNEQVRFIIQILMVLLGLLWVMMQAYIYPLIVTFKLTLPQIYRNALLFAFLRFPYNVMQVFINVIFVIIIPGVMMYYQSGFSLILAFFWYALFAFSFPQFFAMSTVWRSLDKFMIQRQTT
ncbi:MAG: DUF624 domain-containing protein [Eubacteriales bacterium]|nr:DUF624 domain-containing protein [Eubacteriales bacterium]